MTLAEIKQKYLEYYQGSGFAVKPSSGLVNDRIPTSFVMSVGLLQLEPILTNEDKTRWPNFTMVQRCIRHQDIEQAGLGDRLSFFEMAGAISSDALGAESVLDLLIGFLTREMGFDKNSLIFTVYSGGKLNGVKIPRHKEAYEALVRLGVSEDKILELGNDYNLFGAGPRQSFCGPSVEVFIRKNSKAKGRFDKIAKEDLLHDCIEISNNVFIAYRKTGQELKPLKMVYAESAVGVERIAQALNGHGSILDLPEIALVGEKIQKAFNLPKPKGSAPEKSALIAADHLRALSFAIADGGRPGHGGRKYVLRKLIRRFIARTFNQQTDYEQALLEVLSCLAEANRHVLDLGDDMLGTITNVIAGEKAVLYRETVPPEKQPTAPPQGVSPRAGSK